MNISNDTMEASEDSLGTKILLESSDIMEYYLIRVVCAFGLIINSICLMVFSHKSLKEKRYDGYMFLWCRTFSNISVCLFAIDYAGIFCDNCHTNFYVALYKFYFIGPMIRISIVASIYFDMLFILNRYVVLHDKKGYTAFFSKKIIILISFSFALVTAIPNLLGFEVVKDNGYYHRRFKDGVFYKVYIIFTTFLHLFIPAYFCIIMNFVSVGTYRKVMEKKAQMNKDKSDSSYKRAERRFRRMVLGLTYLCCFYRNMDLMNLVIYMVFHLFIYLFYLCRKGP